jgi:uncharacterized membrane protein HdeD (DUF308 family)
MKYKLPTVEAFMNKIANYPRALYITEGVLSCILGLCALILPELSTFSVEQLIGWLLLFLGSTQFIQGIKTYPRRESWNTLLASLIHTFVGILLIRYPLVGIQSLTLWIISQFVLVGALRLHLAYQMYDQKGWEWLAAEGIASWVVAAIILLNWPLTAFWLLGFLSGLNFLSYGLLQIAFGIRGGRVVRV